MTTSILELSIFVHVCYSSENLKIKNDQIVLVLDRFLMHLSRRLKCTIVITRCPSSVVRPSVVNFSYFWLLWNRWTEFNETWQEARSQRLLPSLCFSGRSEKQDGRPGLWLADTFSTSSLKPLKGIQPNWLEARYQCHLPSLCFSSRSEKQDGRPGLWFADTFSTSSLKPLNGIQRKLTGSKISMSSTKFVFFGPIEKQDGRLGLWLAETFSTSSLKRQNGIQRNLTGSKISTSSTKFVFFGQIGKKTRWPPRPLIGWDMFDFFSETVEQNGTKLDRKQDINVLYQVCVFSGRWEKEDGRPGLWLAETFSTSFLKPLNWIQRNLIGSKISMSTTKFVFFEPIGKTRWPPCPLICWHIFDFFSVTAERNSTKVDRKQDINVLYQVCVFRADRKKKMAAFVSDWLRYFRLLLWNGRTEFNETWQEARYQRPLPSLCFSGRSEKQDGRPGLWLAETCSTSSLKPLNRMERNLTGSKISMSSTKFGVFGPMGKKRWPPWPLIGWDIFDFFSETAERNFTGCKISTSSTKFVFFGPILCLFNIEVRHCFNLYDLPDGRFILTKLGTNVVQEEWINPIYYGDQRSQ